MSPRQIDGKIVEKARAIVLDTLSSDEDSPSLDAAYAAFESMGLDIDAVAVGAKGEVADYLAQLVREGQKIATPQDMVTAMVTMWLDGFCAGVVADRIELSGESSSDLVCEPANGSSECSCVCKRRRETSKGRA